GQRFLSINLGLADVEEVWAVSKALGFKPELIKLSYRPNVIEVHALLWQGAIADTPANLDEQFDELCDRFPSEAVWYPAGAWSQIA
ncbi:MAG TPA: hypothetical protein V6D18_17040, partial [Thermosynechococcaceae cyanobacterium]